jgi:TPR repeat protein
MKKSFLRRLVSLCATLVAGCATTLPPAQMDGFEVVDCEVPGAVVRIGAGFSTTARSHAVRTSASDCAIRGGYFAEASAANYATSLKVWQPRADAGDAQAQFYVGRIYDSGLGRAPDFSLASVWYKKAADQGHVAALTALAGLYERGNVSGVPDAKTALDLYRRAANLNEPLVFGRDLRARETEIETLKKELEASRRASELQTETLRRQVQQRDAEAQRLRNELRAIPRAPANAPQVSKAERAVNEAEAELRRESQRLSNAQSEAARARAALNALDQRQTQEAAGAVRIELVEPPMTPMRGLLTVRVAANVTEVNVAARVTSSERIANVQLNDAAMPLGNDGIARMRVSLKGATTPIQILATDSQGRRALLAFVVASESVLPSTPESAAKQDFGNYHALVIGNSRYRDWESLNSPRHDVNVIANVLRGRYGFRVQTLFDATRNDIIRELAKLRATLTPRDNLLVYYAGHGHWDSANQRGYWIPVDGGTTNPANWISSADITDQLSVIPAKQVLVVADSCYSGVLVGSIAAQLDRIEGDKAEWLAKRAQMRSRKVMSSGSIAQVMDGGAQNNSIFARQFINALTRRGEPFEAHELYREVAPQVRRAASDVGGQQEPQYGTLRHAGHEAGDFVFLPRPNS